MEKDTSSHRQRRPARDVPRPTARSPRQILSRINEVPCQLTWQCRTLILDFPADGP
jgi:hypothetical protein